jgi:hypothetical protein
MENMLATNAHHWALRTDINTLTTRPCGSKTSSRAGKNDVVGVINRVLATRLAARRARGGDLKEQVAHIAALETGVLGTTEADCRSTYFSYLA